MTWLASWIQQLILVVIMATFLELLLPNNAMQRYVRLVMGFVILLLIVSPILTVIKRDWSVNAFFASEDTRSAAGMASLPEIEERTRALQEKQQVWIEETVQSRLEQEITAEIEKEFPLEVEGLTVLLADEGHDAEKGIQHIALAIARKDERANRVEPVEPVRITLPGTSGDDDEPADEMHPSPHVKEIREAIARKWDVPLENITITTVKGE